MKNEYSARNKCRIQYIYEYISISSHLQVISSQTGLSKLVAAAWRLRVCGLLQRQYMTRDHYYHVLRDSGSGSGSSSGAIDNPDQRITQDVALFTSTLSQVRPSFSPLSLIFSLLYCTLFIVRVNIL